MPETAVSNMTGTKTVTKSPPELIVPALTTPGGTLPLSSIDKAAGSAGLVNLIQVFAPPSFTAARMSQGAAAAMAAMRDGLARALVPYYPVAGRVAPSGLAVDCTGEGVWFVEAAASCALADVDGLGCCPLLIPGELLLPRAPPGEKLDGLILMVQATRFTCGGFAVGISFSHAVFDGQGAAQFLTAVGELARGLQAPSVTPVWDRDAILDPPSPPPPQLTEFRLVTQVADISAESIARVKDDFKQAAATSTGEVDYGFGAPAYVFPLNDHVNFVASLNYVRPPAPRRGGIRVVLRCVEEPHAAAFAVELAKFA
ncbi:unnamed protein product [Triticum turgidum subsp. durum]|uniref:3'-N-debenzoyl-2'-deoxytaxol N-benzoyltransferase n=1 Tax=Triticum turgidum subsp. durum TaxID=4567 RepID=A0A9R0ZGN1_TRITD|nr:unnamed protein product [Triticum turgidum subsp. durum]